jgi:stage II sporulation protein D
LVALLVLSTGADSPKVEERFRALAASAGQSGSLFRIGLDAGHRLLVDGDRGFKVVDPRTGAVIWRPSYTGEIAIVADGGPDAGAASIYRIQVGAFKTAEAAEKERARLAGAYAAEAVSHFVQDRGSWRVRLGRASDRAALIPLMTKLRAAGLEGLWIAEEPAVEVKGVRIRLVDRSYESFSTDATRLAVVPEPGGRVRVEGKSYRGIVEIRLTGYGTVRAINWVELESYLLGVVPAEMGPEVWPRLEALKAQAVAARTYAWRNRGQFEDEGFDLCGTPRCQVYEGAAAEHPLTDRAVVSTRGEILTFEGKPISALYTATCGGHTENAVDVFPEEDAPYLRGVPCRAEGEALARLRASIRGSALPSIVSETGEEVTRDAALLAAAGVLDLSQPATLAGPLDAGTLRSWTTSLARRAGRPAPAGPERSTRTLAEASVALLADLLWDERARVLLEDEDAEPLLRDQEASALPAAERRALAYLAWTGAIRPFDDGSFGVSRAPTRARLLGALVRVGEAYDAFGLREGTVLGLSQGRVRLAQGKGDLEVGVLPNAYLFGLTGGRSVAVPSLALWPGDRVRFRVGTGGELDFLELRPPVKGASDDRLASVYSWEVRRSRGELEAAINRRVAIGTLLDLEIVRRGVSGRVAELRVTGSDGSTLVKGFDVRNLLDLKESLVVIELQRDSQGRIESIVFAGKGWGHGVGLCQVGAYGMALRGKDYREILAHYYKGSSLDRGIDREPPRDP